MLRPFSLAVFFYPDILSAISLKRLNVITLFTDGHWQCILIVDNMSGRLVIFPVGYWQIKAFRKIKTRKSA